MSPSKLAIVTGMVEPRRTRPLWKSWREQPGADLDIHVTVNGQSDSGEGDPETDRALFQLARPGSLTFSREILGTVGAFAAGMRHVRVDNSICALLHDDLRIDEPDWADTVLKFFETHPDCVAGFGGASGVGVEGMYDRPFDPMSLVRHDFMSNLQEAAVHGKRVTEARRVAVLDGFSLIGREWFLARALAKLGQLGVVHHAYDVYFGALARSLGYETWLLPIACHHHGGLTAVGSEAYQEWARKNHGGDQKIWEHAHRAVWEACKGILPFRVED